MVVVCENARLVTFLVRVPSLPTSGKYRAGLPVTPPLDDRSDQPLRRLPAARLNLPLGAVKIARGGGSPKKRVELRGATAAASSHDDDALYRVELQEGAGCRRLGKQSRSP